MIVRRIISQKYERIFSIVFEVGQGKELLGAVFDEPVKGLLS